MVRVGPDFADEFPDGDAAATEAHATLVRTGGHFEGGTVMHWAAGAGGKGAILSGDLLQVVLDQFKVQHIFRV